MQLRATLLSLVVALGCTNTDLPAGQCLYDSDCAEGSVCASNFCRVGCRTDRDCAAPQVCRESDRAGVLTCHAVVVAAECSLSSDCPAGLVCLDHKCRAQCQGDYDCQVINPFFHCAANACVLTCAAGTADCDADPRNGCEVNLNADPNHCGACATACAVTNGQAQCAGGTCAIARCNTSFDNCDNVASTGCEARIDTAANCGACNRACAAGMVCSADACMTTCAAGTTLCGTACVATATAATDCGACGNACPARANAAPTCAASTCGFACNAGFADCDGATTPGCEARLDSLTNCGTCGHACGAGDNATATCTAGACGITCDAGFHDVEGACIPIRAPRLVSPPSLSTATGNNNVVFNVELAPGTDGAVVELCGDRACATVVESFSGASATVTRAGLLTPGVYFWRAYGRDGTAAGRTPSTQTWEVIIPAGGRAGSGAWGTTPDFNGDGYADVAMGEPRSNRVLVYPGAATGAATTPAQTIALTGEGGGGLGAAIATGDFNGDGFADLATIADQDRRVYVFDGTAAGVRYTSDYRSLTRDVTNYALGVAAASDLNHDGYADLAVSFQDCPKGCSDAGLDVYFGSATGLAETPVTISSPSAYSSFDDRVIAAGRLSPTSPYESLVVTVQNKGPSTAYVFTGIATGIGTEAAQTFNTTNDVQALGALGDLNGDGAADVGFVEYAGGGDNRGVVVYRGGASGLTSFAALNDGSNVGSTVAGLGDVNGDGLADLIASNVSGSARVFYGAAGTPTLGPLLNAPVDADGGTDNSFGWTLAFAGDLNRDGRNDLLVGTRNNGAPGGCTGQLFVYLVPATFPATVLPTVTFGAPEARCFGDFSAERSSFVRASFFVRLS